MTDKSKIQELKDEVAKEYCRIGGQPKCDNWNQFIEDRVLNEYPDDEINQAVTQTIELYHSRKCEEAGRELPDDDKIEEAFPTTFKEPVDIKGTNDDNLCKQVGAEWMKEKASTLLASKQGEIEHWKKRWEKNEERCDISDQNVTNLFLENKELKSQLEVKNKETEELQKELDLKTYQQEGYEKTIQEAKADIERLEGALDLNRLHEMKNYFCVNDKTPFEHACFSFLTNLIEQLKK